MTLFSTLGLLWQIQNWEGKNLNEISLREEFLVKTKTFLNLRDRNDNRSRENKSHLNLHVYHGWLSWSFWMLPSQRDGSLVYYLWHTHCTNKSVQEL